jgi:hypothetical protein
MGHKDDAGLPTSAIWRTKPTRPRPQKSSCPEFARNHRSIFIACGVVALVVFLVFEELLLAGSAALLASLHRRIRLHNAPMKMHILSLVETPPPPPHKITESTVLYPHVHFPARHISLPSWDVTLDYEPANNGSTTAHFPYPRDPTHVVGDISWLRTFNPSIAPWQRRQGLAAMLVASRIAVSWPCDGSRVKNEHGVGYFAFVGLSTPFDGPGMVWLAAPQPATGKEVREAGFEDPRVFIDEEQDRILLLVYLVDGKDLEGAQWLIELQGFELAAALDRSAESGRAEVLFPIGPPLRLFWSHSEAFEKNWVPLVSLTTRAYIAVARTISPRHDVMRCSRFTGECVGVTSDSRGPEIAVDLQPPWMRVENAPQLRGSTQAVPWSDTELLAVGHIMVPAAWYRKYYFFFYTFSVTGDDETFFCTSCSTISTFAHFFSAALYCTSE